MLEIQELKGNPKKEPIDVHIDAIKTWKSTLLWP